MRWAAWVVAACAVLAAGMGSAQAPIPKLALVIGNADYDLDGRIDVTNAGVTSSEAAGFVPDLRNPTNDAEDMRDALTRLGFRVDLVTNADNAAMGMALANFGAKVAGSSEISQVVVFYAGHAIQVDGANFLIPVGARLPASDFSQMPSGQVQTLLRRITVSTTEITAQFRALRAPGVNVLILDACRNNPWEARIRGIGRTANAARGLAEIPAPRRTMIAFSTSPGRVAADGAGRNSPYSASLKNWIEKPIAIPMLFDFVGEQVSAATGGEQEPWVQTSSIGQVCLMPCVSSANSQDDVAEQLAAARRRIQELESSLREKQEIPNGLASYVRQPNSLETFVRDIGQIQLTSASMNDVERIALMLNQQGNSKIAEGAIGVAARFYLDDAVFTDSVRQVAAQYSTATLRRGFELDPGFARQFKGAEGVEPRARAALAQLSGSLESGAQRMRPGGQPGRRIPPEALTALVERLRTDEPTSYSDISVLSRASTIAAIVSIEPRATDDWFRNRMGGYCPAMARLQGIQCISSASDTREAQQCLSHWVNSLAVCVKQMSVS